MEEGVLLSTLTCSGCYALQRKTSIERGRSTQGDCVIIHMFMR